MCSRSMGLGRLGSGGSEVRSGHFDRCCRIFYAGPAKNSAATAKISDFGLGFHKFKTYELSCEILKIMPVGAHKARRKWLKKSNSV